MLQKRDLWFDRRPANVMTQSVTLGPSNYKRQNAIVMACNLTSLAAVPEEAELGIVVTAPVEMG